MNRSRFSGNRSKGFGGSSSRNGYSSTRNNNQRRNNNNSNNNNLTNQINLEKPIWNLNELRPIEKNVYREHPDVANRSNFVINQFLNTNNIVVSGERFINPIFSFDEINFPGEINQIVKSQNFTQPTVIQSMCWPILLSGHDIVGIAQTGSGKTLGFILPLLMQILSHKRTISRTDDLIPMGPLGLIIAPTRELALQIQEVAETFGKPLGINNMCIYGGAARQPQMHQLAMGAEICIATPGRLLDFLKDSLVQLCDCIYLILDEADRMLDMGFEPQITKIIEQIRPDRQTAMFSATWPREVRKLSEEFLSSYIHITIGMSELTVNPNITQIIEVCEERDKENRIKRILRDIMVSYDSKVIMFAETKRRVDNFSKFIRKLGYHCLSIHGDKKQSEREWVLNEFRTKSKSILVATDVAARGLNIEDIKYVVNIDYPNQTEDYIHRIGRTARSTNSGTAYTLVTRDNSHKLPKLIEVLRSTNQEVSRSLLELMNSNKSGYMDNRGGNKRPSRFQDTKYSNHNDHRDFSSTSASNDNYNRKRNASQMINDSSRFNRIENNFDNNKRFRFNNGSSDNSSRNYNNNNNNNSNNNSNINYKTQPNNLMQMSFGQSLSSLIPHILAPPPPPPAQSSTDYNRSYNNNNQQSTPSPSNNHFSLQNNFQSLLSNVSNFNRSNNYSQQQQQSQHATTSSYHKWKEF